MALPHHFRVFIDGKTGKILYTRICNQIEELRIAFYRDKEDRIIMFALTNREQEVLYLVAQGYTDRRIAQSLIISPRTVNRHLSSIFGKLAVPCRTAAVAYAIRIGLI